MFLVTYRAIMLKLLATNPGGVVFLAGPFFFTIYPFGFSLVFDGSIGRPLVSAAIAGLSGCIAAMLESIEK